MICMLKLMSATKNENLYVCCLQSNFPSVYMLKPMCAIRDTFPLLVRLCSTCTDQQGITGRLTTGMSYLVVFTKKNILSILKTIAFEAKIEVYQQFLVFTTQSIGRECNTQRWSWRRRVL